VNGIGIAIALVDLSASVTYDELETRAPLLHNGPACQHVKPGDAVLIQRAGSAEVALAFGTIDAILPRPSRSVSSWISSERHWTRFRSSYSLISWATAPWAMKKSGR
jgi:hypothetical protein